MLGTLLVVVALCIGDVVGCGGIMYWEHCWLWWHYVMGTLLVVVALCIGDIVGCGSIMC